MEDRFEKGLVKHRELMGSAGDEFYNQLNERFSSAANLLMECCFGTVWSRPALGNKARELCTLSALTALGMLPQIRGHVRGALRAGNTKEEILEVLLHMFPYCGWPATLNAINVALEVFEKTDND